MKKDIVERLQEVTGFIRFETMDRFRAAGSLSEEAADEIMFLRNIIGNIIDEEAFIGNVCSKTIKKVYPTYAGKTWGEILNR